MKVIVMLMLLAVIFALVAPYVAAVCISDQCNIHCILNGNTSGHCSSGRQCTCVA